MEKKHIYLLIAVCFCFIGVASAGDMIAPASLSATADSQFNGNCSPIHAVDGSGLVGDNFPVTWGDVNHWIAANTAVDHWIVIDLAENYALGYMKVWNLNRPAGWNSYGTQNASIYTSTVATPGNPIDNPANWTLLKEVTLTKASGTATYDTPDVVDLESAYSRYIAITGTPFGTAKTCIGFSEIQFYHADPISGFTPADNSTDASVDSTQLSWLLNDPNSELTDPTFDVYFGDDPAAVDANSPATLVSANQTGTTYPDGGFLPVMDYSYSGVPQNYYWKIVLFDGGTEVLESSTMIFTTESASPAYLDQPDSQSIAAGADATFIVVAENTAIYTWYKEGSGTALNNNAADPNVLVVPAVTLAEEGQYYCVIDNGDGETFESDRATLWIQRLVGHWKFNGNLSNSADALYGGVMVDPNTNNPTPAASFVTVDTDDHKQALDLSAVAHYVNIPGSEDYFDFYPLGFTVSCWVKSPATTGWESVIKKQDSTGTVAERLGWELGLYQSHGYLVVRGSAHQNLNSGDFLDDTWHLVTAVFGDDRLQQIYIDGEFNSQRQVGASVVIPENIMPVLIGASTASLIDDARIYSYALDSFEVAALYTDLTPGAKICAEYPGLDLTGTDGEPDCIINLLDLAAFASQWLDCGFVPASNCN